MFKNCTQKSKGIKNNIKNVKAHYAKTTKVVASFTQHKTAEVYKQNMLYKGE